MDCRLCGYYHPGETCEEFADHAPHGDELDWPTESQLNDWNIHNDHANG